jgi:outer membrane protein assembly factor BamB
MTFRSPSRPIRVVTILLLTLLAADPAMFRGNPARSGVYSTPTSISTVKWKFKTGARIFSSPAIAEGVVYVGSSDNNLYALSAADGALRWKRTTRGAVNSSPAVVDGTVFFTSRDGLFYAVDVSTGKDKWTFKTEGERRFTAPGIHGANPRTETMPDPYDVFLSSPAVTGGVVYFGSGDGHVYALSAATGELKWKFKTGDVVHASPAVADGVVYIGSWDRHLYALNAATGGVLWRFQTGDDPQIHNQIGIASSAAVAGGVVYFGCRDGHFYAVDAKTGKEKWNIDNRGGWVIASPAVRDGVVYFPTSDGQRFKAVNAATGEVRFDIGMKAISFSSPALAGNTAFFGTSDGWLHAVDVTSGKSIAEFQTDGSKENAAKWVGPDGRIAGTVYPDSTLDGMIIGLDRMFSLGSILSSPAIADGVLFVGSTDGHVYAMR